MIDRTQVCFFVLIITLTCSTVLIAQNPTGNDLFESMLKQESSQKLSSEEINEIVAIRNRLGGGTGLELSAVLEEPPFPEEENPELYFAQNDDSQPLVPIVAAEKLFWQMLDAYQPRPPKPQANSTVSRNSEIEPLRVIARRLEELAADMEELNLFEGADGLRNQAARVRQQSRQQIRNARQNANTIR